MKKLFILLSICLLASVAIQAQRVNKNGLKMVSRVFVYGTHHGKKPSIYTYQYDENDELERITFRRHGGTMIFKKSGNTINVSLEDPSDPDYHFSCKLNEWGLPKEYLRYCMDNDGSGDALVEIYEFQYDYNGGQYRIASVSSSSWNAWNGKPREEWTYSTPDRTEEHCIHEFLYPAPDQLLEVWQYYTMKGRASTKHRLGFENTEYMNDTNICVHLLPSCLGVNEIYPLVISEWCGNKKEAIPFFSCFSDDLCEQKLGFDKKGNFVGLWIRETFNSEPERNMWGPCYMIEYVDGDPIETDQFGNDLRKKK